MASLLEKYTDAMSQDFRKRVTVALYTAARNVSSEAKGATTAVFLKRSGLANRVLFNAENFVNQFSLAIVAGDIVTSASVDSDIQFTVNSLWDAFAGVNDLDREEP